MTSIGSCFLWILLLYSAFIGVQLAPNVFVDDAAISFRYVDRIISGHGFTYNDHEHVQGASNPLYVLILVIVRWMGVDIITATRFVGLVLFVISILLSYYLASRFSNPWGGLLAGFSLATESYYRYQALWGMESVLSVVLGLSVMAALLRDQKILAGVFLGLAIWNKLDAGLLALAIGVVWVLGYKKFPWRIALPALVVALPWFLFAFYYYGSFIPQSLIAKIGHGKTNASFDPLWVINLIRENYRYLWMGLMMFSLALLKRIDLPSKTILWILLGWFVLHAVAFSVLNLGDNYPWYLTILFPPMIILAAAAIFSLRPIFTIGFCVIFAIPMVIAFKETVTELQKGNPLKPFEVFDNDRRLAGIFLNQYAGQKEVVQSYFGWVAYESKMPFDDVTLLNSRIRLSSPSYYVTHGTPYDQGSNSPVAPAGYIRLADFDLASQLFPGHSWFTVFSKPDSVIALSGKRYLKYHLKDFSSPSPYSDSFGLTNIQIRESSMDGHPPSGAVFQLNLEKEGIALPCWLTFTPAFNPAVPKEKTDGVTFEVLINDQSVYKRHLLPADSGGTVVLLLEKISPTFSVAFITSGGPVQNTDYDWAIWNNIQLIIGDAFVDVSKIENKKLVKKWYEYNSSLKRMEHP